MELKPLDFVAFVRNRKELYRLLDADRARVAPWFYWATMDKTPNKYRFYLFMIKDFVKIKFNRVLYRFDLTDKYSKDFIVYNDLGHIGGLCGLNKIDATKHTAEVWGLAFRGNTKTGAALKMLEEYCINTLKLDSFYACVESNNRACRKFWEKYGYDNMKEEQRYNPHTIICTYTKCFGK